MSERRIPPPPGRAPAPDGDDPEWEAAIAAPDPKEQRSDFRDARRKLVDLLVSGSGGTVDWKHFNGYEVHELDRAAAEAGIRPWGETVGENKALRQALAHEIASSHKIGPDDLADVLDPSQPFDLDGVLERANQLQTERSQGARQLMTDALESLGVDVSSENFDPAEFLRNAANPQPAQPKADPWDSPAYRTANMPQGRPFDPTQLLQDMKDGGAKKSGAELIEDAARESLRAMGIRA
jgi:hypothetical protein